MTMEDERVEVEDGRSSPVRARTSAWRWRTAGDHRCARGRARATRRTTDGRGRARPRGGGRRPPAPARGTR